MIQFALTGDRVALELAPKQDKSKGGIYIPEKAQKDSNRGKVVAVGPGKFSEEMRQHVQMGVSVGQQVEFFTYNAREVEIDGATYTIIREDDVICVLA